MTIIIMTTIKVMLSKTKPNEIKNKNDEYIISVTILIHNIR